MSLFHIAIVENTLSMMSVNSGYTVERSLDNIPEDIRESLLFKLQRHALAKVDWTKTPMALSPQEPLYLWFLFERAEELRNMEQQDYFMEPAMSVYSEYLPSYERSEDPHYEYN
jgi:hypothetical protein